MRKGDLLNSEILHTIATMGHTDSICVADCGLPIPSRVARMDIALVKGVPSFLQTLEIVLREMHVESAVIAAEMTVASPDLYAEVVKLMGEVGVVNDAISVVSHVDFKSMTATSKGVIRTGEQTPYANIILNSGVPF